MTQLYPSISIVIASFNGAKHLNEFFDSVIKAVEAYKGKSELIIVDDQSTDNSVPFLKSKQTVYPKFSFFVNDKKGVCSARNLGAHKSKYDFILFLDNDVLLESNYLNVAQKYLHDNTFMVACSGYNLQTKQQQDGIKLLFWKRGAPRFTKNILNNKLQSDKQYLSYGIQGAYFFCQKRYFMLLNGFDEDLFEPYLLEETDLAYRGLKRGWNITYAPDLKGWHKMGGTHLVKYGQTCSTPSTKPSPYRKYLAQRSRAVFVLKNIHSMKLRVSFFVFFLLGLFRTNHLKTIVFIFKNRKILNQKAQHEKKSAKVDDYFLLYASQELEEKSLRIY